MSMTPRGWSISALAVELGMDRRTVAKRIADIEPASESGNAKLYRLADVLPAIAVADVAKPADYEDARTRKMAADAILAEMEVQQKRSETILLTDMYAVLADDYVSVRSKLLAIPDKYAGILEITEGEDAKHEVLRNAIVDALEDLSSARDLGPATDTDAAGDSDSAEGPEGASQSAAGTDGKRMGGRGKKAKR